MIQPSEPPAAALDSRATAGRRAGRRRTRAIATVLALACDAAWAQDGAVAPAAAASAPSTLQRVQISGSTAGDTDARRQSTAAKIVVGREEIERFGDSNVADVLKRLPGVTTGGAPGRRGGPRMRGLGGGYTQLLINGEPIPTGFSLESLTPEQVERIEILRAPTAEYGARAIAGTINIVLREALQRRINDLRIGTGIEGGRVSPGLSWTRNDKLGEAPGSTYNLSLSVFHRNRSDLLDSRTRIENLDSGATVLEQLETGVDRDRRIGANLSGRLQWRLGGGNSLSLQPFVLAARTDSEGRRHLEQPVGSAAPPFAEALVDGRSSFEVARINGQWQRQLSDSTRLDLRLGGGGFDSRSHSLRQEFDAAGTPSRLLVDDTSINERSLTSLGKLTHELASEHSLVSGWDVELVRRNERRDSLQNGVPLLAGFGNEVDASSQRLALYAQDEWSPSRQWSAYAGLRWEQITTRSEDPANPVERRSAVWTPLLQAVWKPDEKSRDQIRLALTRSYKSPTLRSLIARPSLSTRYPAPGGNEATSPDSVGNPQLRPELATGIDLAYEHYLASGGLLSVNLFHRQIRDLIRTVTTLQAVPWAQQPRWVAQPRNVGDAVTQGIELELKARLDELRQGLPPVALRGNLSLFRSRVDGVPGPDNRLDEQPAGTANLGADYRFRAVPLALGGNLNWTPATVIRQTETQLRSSSTKRSFEAFAVWTFDPTLALRIGASDLFPLDYTTVGSIDTGALRDSTETRNRTRTNWTLRLEMKL